MKQFSDCSGPCEVCTAFGFGCLAGHGDDDFHPHSDEKLEEMLKTGIRRQSRFQPFQNGNAPEQVALTDKQKGVIGDWLNRKTLEPKRNP